MSSPVLAVLFITTNK